MGILADASGWCGADCSTCSFVMTYTEFGFREPAWVSALILDQIERAGKAGSSPLAGCGQIRASIATIVDPC